MQCFVIMPFGNPKVDPTRAQKLDAIYSQWIKPTVESISLTGLANDTIACHRADKEERPGEIISHIIENLTTSDIVIADLSGRNPNVFYELGVRHAVRNNTILISEDLDDIPFDLRGLRTITYGYDPEHMLKLKDSLARAIRAIHQRPETVDNPVQNFLYQREMKGLAERASLPGFTYIGLSLQRSRRSRKT